MANLTRSQTSSSDTSLQPVSEGDRMARLPLTMAWWAVCSAMFYIVVGATLALNYGARNAIIGMVLSVICYGLINGVISRYAIRTGQSVAVFSREVFGTSGAALATLIFFATAIYYAVFEGAVMAIAAHHIFPSVPYAAFALLVVVYSVLLIFGSVQRWLDKFNGILLPFYLGGLLLAVVLATKEYGYSDAWLSFGPASGPVAGGWWDAFVYYMGVWILMMFTFDYARFGRRKDAKYHSRYNFGMPFYLVTFLLNGLAGIYLVSTIPGDGALSEVSVVLALLKLMGLGGLFFVWVTQTRINTANYYLATINMQAFFAPLAHWPKAVWAVIAGVLAYLLMLFDVFAYLLQALAYQGIFVVAWVAVALVHMSGRATVTTGETRAFNHGGLGAWLIGALSGLVLMHLPGFASTLAAPASFVVSALVYWSLSRPVQATRPEPN
ncbi:purine-cytosine permease family protein [Bordetella avium]|uniref:Permease n=1 Tax=Bordetella avium (strain 197N) TaxID=360910 RepID=Q2KTV4_BORA1|nr:allantoin permease [Bordetella avium]AZY54014.1 allantoin permease [Bordetella avium]RIQ19981.1 allantoin permease [Bordetella avium]RIQ34561.1 allantoin permease [Bordetella avium]RIQ55741.1 allantoin permease [Bordetella avium]RIQ69998.1 allantoin permease [Bordetella avium]